MISVLLKSNFIIVHTFRIYFILIMILKRIQYYSVIYYHIALTRRIVHIQNDVILPSFY